MKAADYKIPLIHIVLGVLWITLSDGALDLIADYINPGTARYIASIKGILYVISTGILLYFLIKNERKKLIEGDNKRMAAIVDKMNNIIIISDINGKITWVNRAFLNITGYTMKETLGQSPGSLLYGPDTDFKVVERIHKAIANKELFSGELLNYAKDKTIYWSQFNLSPIYGSTGDLEGYISVENNINDRKQKEYEIFRQHEKLKEVSWLNSHEIRKPVASILALTDLILKEESEEEKKELMDYLRKTTLQLDDIIHQINQEAAIK